MLNITVTPDAAARLKALLEDEGGDMCVRVRETHVGTPCKRRIVLRLSIDEREDDDVESMADGLPFAVPEDLIEQYGEDFSVSLDEQQMPIVTAAN